MVHSDRTEQWKLWSTVCADNTQSWREVFLRLVEFLHHLRCIKHLFVQFLGIRFEFCVHSGSWCSESRASRAFAPYLFFNDSFELQQDMKFPVNSSYALHHCTHTISTCVWHQLFVLVLNGLVVIKDTSAELDKLFADLQLESAVKQCFHVSTTAAASSSSCVHADTLLSASS